MKKVIQVAHRAEEIVIISHKMMKEEEGRRTAAVKAFELIENKSQELTAKLVEVDRDKKSAWWKGKWRLGAKIGRAHV